MKVWVIIAFLTVASTTPPPEISPGVERPHAADIASDQDEVTKNKAAVERCVDRGVSNATCYERQPNGLHRLNRAQVDAINQRRSLPPSSAPTGRPSTSRPMRNCASGRC